jgi:hypothetical protein
MNQVRTIALAESVDPLPAFDSDILNSSVCPTGGTMIEKGENTRLTLALFSCRGMKQLILTGLMRLLRFASHLFCQANRRVQQIKVRQ